VGFEIVGCQRTSEETDEAQPSKHSGERARTGPKRALQRGPSGIGVIPLVSPLVSRRASTEGFLRLRPL
jgi:hypothetical protein